MRTVAVIVLGVALVACGGSGDDDDSSSASSIIGTWGLKLSNGCLATLDVTADGYEGDVICTPQSGVVEIDAEIGDYSINGSMITMTPKSASCPTNDHSPATLSFKVSGNQLTLTDTSGALKMDRLADSGTGSGVAAYGCIDRQSGAFTQHDIGPL